MRARPMFVGFVVTACLGATHPIEVHADAQAVSVTQLRDVPPNPSGWRVAPQRRFVEPVVAGAPTSGARPARYFSGGRLRDGRMPWFVPTPGERARLEASFSQIPAHAMPTGRAQLERMWASYVLLLRGVTGHDGKRRILVDAFSDDHFSPNNPVTLPELRGAFGVKDGGCSLWHLVFVLEGGSIELFTCNGHS